MRSVHESGTVRLRAIRNRAKTESGPWEVSTPAPTQLPRGVHGCYCATRTLSHDWTGPPRQRGPAQRTGHETMMRRRGESEPGKVRQPPQWGGVKNHVTSLQTETQPERQEVRPVTRGQRPAKSRCRPRVKGADVKLTFAGTSAPRPAPPLPAGSDRTGRRGLTR